MIVKTKVPSLFALLLVMISAIIISGCSSTKVNEAKPQPKAKIELITAYNRGQAHELPKDSRQEMIDELITSFADLKYGIVKLPDTGNQEVKKNMQQARGLLIRFDKETDLGIPGLFPAKRIYIPLTGSLVKNNSAIMLASRSADSWDWVGFTVAPKDRYYHIVKELKNVSAFVYFEGEITAIYQERILVSIDADKTELDGVEKILLHRRSVDLTPLKVGQKVKVWTEGFFQPTDPPQAGAIKIEAMCSAP